MSNRMLIYICNKRIKKFVRYSKYEQIRTKIILQRLNCMVDSGIWSAEEISALKEKLLC